MSIKQKLMGIVGAYLVLSLVICLMSFVNSESGGGLVATLSLISVIVAAAGLVVINMMLTSLERLSQAMTDFARGNADLGRRLDVGGDQEVGGMSQSFNEFVDRVEHLIVQVKQFTDQMSEKIDAVTQVAEQNQQGLLQQQSETQQVASATNQMMATLQEVGHNTATASSTAREATSKVSEGRGIIEQTEVAMRELSKEVNDSEGVIQKVAEESENIGGILDTIRGIAEQTNLLALNAAIEAARAGEQGRGFAVVADEVRNLAQRTQTATQEIQGMIETLQIKSNDSKEAMQRGRQKAEEGVGMANQSGDMIQVIFDQIQNIDSLNTQIASATKQQTDVSEEISRNMLSIADIADHTKDGAQQIQMNLSELSSMSQELDSLIGQFKVG